MIYTPHNCANNGSSLWISTPASFFFLANID